MQWESLLFVYYSHAYLRDQETMSFCPQGLRQVCVSACGNIQIMYLHLRRALQCPRAGHHLFAVRKASGSGLLCSAPSSTTWRVHAPRFPTSSRTWRTAFLISFASCPFLQRPKQKKHVRGALASHWYLPSGRVHGPG